jgi:lipopolysaccharide biosynthesis glycosyltransferase
MTYNITIGYDRNNRMPAYVLAESIMRNSSINVNFTFLHRDMLGNLSKPIEEFDSTEFSNNRFLTPYLQNYQGYSLFLDNDIVVDTDIKELFDMIDDRYHIMCVKHSHLCEEKTKFKNKLQYQYNFKNWSSVMLFNNSKCKILTPEYVRNNSGLNLHQFKWLNHELIGDLPLEWNYLVGCKNQTDNKPKLIHYTLGGPFYKKTQNCEYSEKWNEIYHLINDVER